jgi:hypothetical protein
MVGLLHSAIVAAPSANEEPLPAIDSETHAAFRCQLAEAHSFAQWSLAWATLAA